MWANGDQYTKDEYLAEALPDVANPRITDVVGTQSGESFVVSWTLVVDLVTDGVTQPTDPAPRLTTFVRDGDDWLVTSHANFGAVLPSG